MSSAEKCLMKIFLFLSFCVHKLNEKVSLDDLTGKGRGEDYTRGETQKKYEYFVCPSFVNLSAITQKCINYHFGSLTKTHKCLVSCALASYHLRKVTMLAKLGEGGQLHVNAPRPNSVSFQSHQSQILSDFFITEGHVPQSPKKCFNP